MENLTAMVFSKRHSVKKIIFEHLYLFVSILTLQYRRRTHHDLHDIDELPIDDLRRRRSCYSYLSFFDPYYIIDFLLVADRSSLGDTILSKQTKFKTKERRQQSLSELVFKRRSIILPKEQRSKSVFDEKRD